MRLLAKIMVVAWLMVGSWAHAEGVTWGLKGGVLSSTASTGGTVVAPGLAWGGVVGNHIGYEIAYLEGSLGSSGKDQNRALNGTLVFWGHLGLMHPKLKVGGSGLWNKASAATHWSYSANFTYGAGVDFELGRDILLGVEWNKISNDLSFTGVSLTWK